ncbi:MAG: leucine-rich repeat protein [Oscillibacter sp.]|nr:leucine-rich repeat protein [Oscillibacter sp.]
MKKQNFLVPVLSLLFLTLLMIPVRADDAAFLAPPPEDSADAPPEDSTDSAAFLAPPEDFTDEATAPPDEAALLATTKAYGECGTGMAWRLDVDGVMTISGKGAMANYSSGNVIPWRNYRLDIQKVNFEQGVTRVGNYAFCDCKTITAVTIPQTLKVIGDSAFANCEYLSDIAWTEGLQEIGNYAFTGCIAIKNLSLPKTVSKLGQASFSKCTRLTDFQAGETKFTETKAYLFKDCTNLKTVVFPETLKTIGQETFSGCSALTDYTIPPNVTKIASQAFKGCNWVTSIELPPKLSTIEEGVFLDCIGLEYVVIPESVKTIKKGAFTNCPALKNVYYAGNIMQWEAVSKNDFADMIQRNYIEVHYGEAPPVSTATIVSLSIANGRVTVDVGGEPEKGSTLFIASYDADGCFLGVDTHPIDDPNAYTVFAKEAHTLTVFLLDSHQRPAAPAVSKEVPAGT